MLRANSEDRSLSDEQGAALLGGAMPLEARLKSNVSRRRGIIQASEAARQVISLNFLLKAKTDKE